MNDDWFTFDISVIVTLKTKQALGHLFQNAFTGLMSFYYFSRKIGSIF